MEDQAIHQHIESLVTEEHKLLEHGESGKLTPQDRLRLEEVQVQLDRYFDLLRQRRARRDAGQDPEVAHMRTADTVEHYQQ
jgi:Protein of unknown function (DUF2630)